MDLPQVPVSITMLHTLYVCVCMYPCMYVCMYVCIIIRDGQLTINRDIFFVNNQYQAIFTTNNNCEKQ